jgi:phospholipase C
LKPRVFRNEHPNFSKITDGAMFVKKTIDFVLGSPKYKDNTLVLLTWDEGGGFFDHVAPPPAPPVEVDADPEGNPVPYGTRVPLLAVGAFAKPGSISHVTMEHSSIVKFVEYNFLTQTGQLKARDGWATGIGSILDQSKTGIPIPE